MKQLEKVPAERAVYVPLGKAYLFPDIKLLEEKQRPNHQVNFKRLGQAAIKLQRHVKQCAEQDRHICCPASYTAAVNQDLS